MVERLEKFSAQVSVLPKMTPFAAINFIRKGIGYDDYILEYCKERHMNSEELLDILEELQMSAKDYKTYAQWFAHIEDYREQLQQVKQNQDVDAVLLSTLHASKGLEFEAVFLLDACEGVTPHKKAIKDDEIEEERRLFYVGMTRAKRHLSIYVVEQIFNKKMTPSRFVSELEFDRRRLAVGVRVRHQKYGDGVITYLDDKRMSIFFEEEKDTKTFHIAFAISNGYVELLD
jgi:DNA helicase-2/ATP-dependent DNA helicase PcrA